MENKNQPNNDENIQSPSIARTINFNDVGESNVNSSSNNGKQEQQTQTQQQQSQHTRKVSSGENPQLPLKSNMKKSRSVSEELAQLAPPKVVSMWKEFANFAFQGNVIDLSIGLIMGIFIF